jgi:hypothetical protein
MDFSKLTNIFHELGKSFDLSKLNHEQFHELLDKLLYSIEHLVRVGYNNIPMIEKWLIDSLDAMFAPKLIIRQAITIAAIQVTLLTWNSASDILTFFYQMFSSRGKKEKKLIEQVSSSRSYPEWKHYASQLDTFRGLDSWRLNPGSKLYDYKLVKKRIEGTKEMLNRGDVFDLMFRIRGALSRDQFGIQSEGLFNRALGGTKYLIEEYHETMARGLNFICDSPIADEEVNYACCC